MDDGNCKSSFAPPSVIWNGAMKQVNRLGKTISMMGMINFWPEKKLNNFLSFKGSRHFPRVRFLSEQSYICCNPRQRNSPTIKCWHYDLQCPGVRALTGMIAASWAWRSQGACSHPGGEVGVETRRMPTPRTWRRQNCSHCLRDWTQLNASWSLGWEIRSEFRGILQLFWFRTSWTPEFSSEFYFSDRKSVPTNSEHVFSGSESSPAIYFSNFMNWKLFPP